MTRINQKLGRVQVTLPILILAIATTVLVMIIIFALLVNAGYVHSPVPPTFGQRSLMTYSISL